MKIKCPYCETEVNNSAEMCGHLTEHGEYFCIESLSRLIFKIYEKIEVLKKSKTNEVDREFLMLELKSLLENDKK